MKSRTDHETGYFSSNLDSDQVHLLFTLLLFVNFSSNLDSDQVIKSLAIVAVLRLG